eukprot:TRINITY_DN24910_c0_g1_i1.p1 TRINITY_DN24910_c0_g1~~TRINITY_DN24910_c0_g1_i1.p1  ORF type:complete len:178 (-),score=23.83 TRINITY_DN24910_c0_g1_i1:31-564(-)
MFVRVVLLLALVCVSLGQPDNCRCVFKVGTQQQQKLGALDYVCANFNCSAINPGGPCQYPDTIEAHSSWAIDAWFQAHRDNAFSCDFGGIAELLCESCQCMTTTNATDIQMKDAITFVCAYTDCTPIFPGGSHYLPNTLTDHCNWAVNAWYQAHSWAPESCDFNHMAALQPQDCQGR